MASKKKKSLSMTDHITKSMRMLDSQVAREMQRSPAEREAEGVQKWEPYRKRVERVVSHVVGEIGAQEIELDSLLIVAEAFPRVLRILVEEFGEEGLGKVRSAYCREIFNQIERDLLHAKQVFEEDGAQMQ